jgi:hypothetical protein
MPPTYVGPYPNYEDAWYDRALGWLGKKLGLGNVADEDDFWIGAQQGQIMCAGPFSPVRVLELLQKATPDAVERARASVYARSWYRKYPPDDLAQLAGMLVAEAHGGRDCSPNDIESLNAARAIRSLAEGAPGGGIPGLDFPPLEAGAGSLLPLLALGVGAYYFMRKS